MKKMIVSTVALVVVSVSSYVAYPWVLGQVKESHPVGYVRYVESKLASDLETMNTARFTLGAEVKKLSKQNTDLTARVQRARSLANDFRVAYQKAEKNGEEATIVHGCAYTRTQIHSQVSLLLAEAEGYEESLNEIDATLAEGERRLEQFAVQIGKTESQLAMLATKRELIHVQELTIEGEELLANVDQLMIENSQAVAYSPVRPSWEIQDDSENEAVDRTVAQFLAAEPDEVPIAAVAAYVEISEEETRLADFDTPPAPRPVVRSGGKQTVGPPVEPIDNRPIFKQSVSQK